MLCINQAGNNIISPSPGINFCLSECSANSELRKLRGLPDYEPPKFDP